MFLPFDCILIAYINMLALRMCTVLTCAKYVLTYKFLSTLVPSYDQLFSLFCKLYIYLVYHLMLRTVFQISFPKTISFHPFRLFITTRDTKQFVIVKKMIHWLMSWLSPPKKTYCFIFAKYFSKMSHTFGKSWIHHWWCGCLLANLKSPVMTQTKSDK